MTGEFEIGIATEKDRAEVNEFVKAHPSGQIEHTWEGCRLLPAASGGLWRAEICVCRRDGRLLGVMPVAVARMGFLPFRACRSAGGPIVDVNAVDETAKAMLERLVGYAAKARCCRVELSLDYPESIGGQVFPGAAKLVSIAVENGLHLSAKPRRGTYWVRLSDDEDMLASLSKKCRRDVRKGLREDVTVALKDTPAALEEFHRAYRDMCGRKSLPPRDAQFFAEGVLPCLKAGLVGVFVSSYQGRACNMALITLTGRPRYWLGATAAAGLDKGCPPTGQVLHFGIMQHLRDMGRKVYDLGGSPGPVPEPGHPNYGVWKFKHEFNGQWVVYLGDFERVLSRSGDLLIRIGWRMRRAIRKARGSSLVGGARTG